MTLKSTQRHSRERSLIVCWVMVPKSKHLTLKKEINKLSQLRLKTRNKYNTKNKQHKMKKKWKRRTLEISKIQVMIKNRNRNLNQNKRRTLKRAKI